MYNCFGTDCHPLKRLIKGPKQWNRLLAIPYG